MNSLARGALRAPSPWPVLWIGLACCGGTPTQSGKGSHAGATSGGTSPGLPDATTPGSDDASGGLGDEESPATIDGGAPGEDAPHLNTGTGADSSAQDAGPLDDAAAGTPTASSWVGTNVSADLPRVDITYQLTPFDTAAAQKDTNGYPISGASGTSQTDIGYILPTGTYKISYVGTGSLAVSGIGQLTGPWQTANGEQRSSVQITGMPGSFGQILKLAITNGAGQTVQNIHIYYPGFDYDTPTVFLPQFLRLLTPFRALRFMGWQDTNDSTIVDWADRSAASHFGASPQGEPYEHITDLVNQTGEDCWINVPEHASDDFVQQFAQFLAANLNLPQIQAARARSGLSAPFQIVLENSNETWNNGFTAYATFLAEANAAPTRYTGVFAGTFGPTWQSQSTDLMKVAQYEADRLVKIATLFRQALQGSALSSAVSPVLGGWAIGAAYSDEGLHFIKDNYGNPSDYVRYVALAPYFSPDDAQTTSLAALFASADANIASMDATLQDFAKLAASFSIDVAAYEGGQGISGATNLTIKHLAQHDERMYQAYGQYFALWKKDFGESLFMHFSLADDPGLPESFYQYGFWGSIIGVLEDPSVCSPNLPTLLGTEPVASVVHHCPKYRALAEQVPQ